MERILITGALGQLGNAFVKNFNKTNSYLLATDIKHPKKKMNCDFEILDVLNKEKIDLLVEKYKINIIYHLAAILSANGEINPFNSWKLNMDSFQNIAEVSIKHNIEKIFWPSSIAVFGTESKLSLVSQNPSMNPSTMYGVTKLAGEKLANYYFKKFKLDIRSLRYPGVISTKTVPGGGTTDYVIEMINAAKKEKNYNCYLHKDTELPMIYIDDAIESAIKLMSIERKKISIYGSYNITSFSISPKKLIEEINKNGYKIKVEYNIDSRQKIADSWPRKIDDSKAKNDWGWKPKYGLDSSIKKSLND